MNIDRDSGTTEAIIHSLNRLGERVNEIESAMATHNHIAEDDEESDEELHDIISVYAENHQLLIANQILHDKVRGLREQIAEMEEEYDSEVPEEDVNMDLVKQVAEIRAENKLLADICEERDAQIAASIKRERQYVAMLKLASVCNA